MFCLYACMPTVCLDLAELRRGVRSPGTGVLKDCEPPHGAWELSSDPLEVQPVLLSAESFPSPRFDSHNTVTVMMMIIINKKMAQGS